MLRKQSVDLIKCVYLCALVVYAVLRDVVPVYIFVSNSTFSYLAFGAGVVLIMLDFRERKRRFFEGKNSWLTAFLGVCILSALLNYSHSMSENVKTVCWLVLFFYLIYASGAERNTAIVRCVFSTYSVTMTVLALISLPMYFFDVGYTVYKANGAFTDQGFSFLYSRLWGVFQEANYAACYMNLAMLISVYLALTAKSKVHRIVAIVQCVMFLTFVVLSASRTAMLVLMLGCAWMAVYIAYHWFQGRDKHILLCSCAGVASLVLVFVIMQGINYGLPYLKVGINHVIDRTSYYQVQDLYDRLYLLGNVEIEESSTQMFPKEQEQLEPTKSEVESMQTEPSVTKPVATEPLVTEPVATEPSVTKSVAMAPLVTELVATAPLVTEPVTTEPSITEAKPPESPVVPLDRTDSKNDISNGRLLRWKTGLQIFCKTPLLGTSLRGVNSFAREHFPDTYIAKYNYSISNSYLEVLTGTGLVGFAIIAAFLLLSAAGILKNAFKNQCDFRFMLLSAVVLMIVAASVLQSDIFFSLTASGFLFWFVIGMLNSGENTFARDDKNV